MEQSQIADFIVVMMGGSPGNLSDSEIEVENFLRKQENVTEYTADDILYLTKSQIRLDQDKDFVLNTTVLVNSCNAKQQLFFDSGNNQITEMADGTIYLPRRTITENDLKPGDVIHIQTENGYQKSFRLMGYFKDAFLGSDMMGTQRYLVSDADFKEMLEKAICHMAGFIRLSVMT